MSFFHPYQDKMFFISNSVFHTSRLMLVASSAKRCASFPAESTLLNVASILFSNSREGLSPSTNREYITMYPER